METAKNPNPSDSDFVFQIRRMWMSTITAKVHIQLLSADWMTIYLCFYILL